MTTSTRVLTVAEAVKLGSLIDAVISSKRARWLVEGTNDVATGTLRSVGDENGFAGPEDDVRDCFIRITTSSGFERFVPVTDVLRQIVEGTFAVEE